MIKDPYIGMPIIIDTESGKPGGCCCCNDSTGGVTDDDTGGNTGDIGGEISPMPPTHDGGFDNMYLGDLPLAMCYVPMQRWNTTYSLQRGLERGTIFPELDLPFTGGRER